MFLQTIYICILLKLIHATNLTLDDLSYLKTIPYADQKQTLSINDSTTTVKTESFGKYFYRLDSNRTIRVWDTSDPSACTLVCSASSPNTIQDFAIDIWNGQFAFVDANKTITVLYPNCTLNGTFNVNYSTVDANVFFSFTYVGLWFTKRNTTDRGNSYTFRYWRSNFTFVHSFEFWEFNGSEIRLSHSVKPKVPWNVAEFFLVYNQASSIRLYGWDHQQWPIVYGVDSAPPSNNYNWAIKSAKFDYDSGYIYITYGPPLNKITVVYHAHTVFVSQIFFPVEVYNAVPVDQKGWMLAVFFVNDSTVFYNVSRSTTGAFNQGQTMIDFTFLFEKNLSQSSSQVPLSKSTSMFYVANDNQTAIYELKCPSGVRLGMGLCLDDFDAAIEQNSKSQQLKFLFTAIKIMALAVTFMQVTPFACVFLRFINFWTICSIYSMVEIRTQEPLTSILYQIYVLINASLFQILGIKLDMKVSNQEKVFGKYATDYQITSNLTPTIIEPIVCTLIMCICLYAFEWIKHKFFSQDNKRKFQVSKLKIFFGQYVSFLSVFMFPLKFVYLSLNQVTYTEKWNQTFHMIFICIGLMIPFVLIFLNGQKLKKVTKAGKTLHHVGFFTQKSFKSTNQEKIVSQQVSILTFEYLQFSYISLVNIIMPILGTITSPQWFALICGCLIMGGIFVDTKRTQWRINSIIMSSELMIFHLCFCLDLLNLSEKGRYVISVISMTILMIGALHEVLTLFARICVDTFLLFCKESGKIGDQVKRKDNQAKSVMMAVKIRQQLPAKKAPRQQQTDSKPELKLKSSLKQSVTRNQVKVEEINPGQQPDESILKLSIKQKSIKLNFNKITKAQQGPKKQDQSMLNDEIYLGREGTVKKSTYKSKFKLRAKANLIINEKRMD